MRQALVLTFLVASMAFAGCLEGPSVPSGSRGDTSEAELTLPQWSVGDQWLYTFSTPQFGEDSARLVVAEVDEEEGLYRLGISSEREAQRHAVINHNPFLGRVTVGGLSVYEEGEPQPVFKFPWNEDATWTFVLFGQSWTASTVNIYNGVADVVANSAEGHRLTYAFSGREGFLDALLWVDDEGVEQLRMELTQSKTGYEGNVYFYQARDLLDNRYEASDTDIYDSFLDSGHPSGEDWDVLVWYLDVGIASGGSGSLVMKDHQGASPLTRVWGSGATERGAIGTIPSISGEYGLTVNLRGDTSSIHLKVAGGIITTWTL